MNRFCHICDSDRIQTCNLLIRSQMLYSVEPRSLYEGANIRIFRLIQMNMAQIY